MISEMIRVPHHFFCLRKKHIIGRRPGIERIVQNIVILSAYEQNVCYNADMLRLSTVNIFNIFKSFYTLNHVRIVLVDADLVRLLSYPEGQGGFCGLIRQDPAVNEKCLRCDRDGCEMSARRGDLAVYRCHAGLVEAAVPIMDPNGILGYIMFGQLIPHEDAREVKESLLAAFPEERFPGIRSRIEDIEIKTREEIEAAAVVLRALATYVLSNRWVTPDKADFIRHLDRYVISHIREPILVEDLCAEFAIGKTRLYEVAGEYLGRTLMEYVRHARIEYAKTLLERTSLSISAVAENTGFSDYNRFSRIFRKEEGMSAGAYRRMVRERTS